MISSLMLIGAVVASLAFGILVAYALCTAMFAVFRMRTEQLAAQMAVQALGGTPQGSPAPSAAAN